VTSRALRELHELKVRVLARRPELARRTAQAVARVDDHLGCRIEEDGRAILADLAAEDGGSGPGPHPDQLMRAALAAGLAAGYRLWAALLEVPVEAIEVTVACDEDTRGALGLTGSPVGWLRLRVEVTIASDRPEADVRRVVESANRASAVLANLSADIARLHRLVVIPAERGVPSEVTPSLSRRRF
jgi:putative redox protein